MIQEKRLLNEFRILAGFDSESFHEQAIADYLYQKLEALGLEVYMDDAGQKLSDNPQTAGNIYGILKGNTGGEPLLLSAHMDTVAPGNGKKVLICEDGRVTSDGTTVLGSDDLSGIVTILEVLNVIVEENLPHPDLEVVFFAAEEPYCRGSAVFDFSRIRARQAYVFDMSGPVGQIANSAPTILQLKLEIIGKSAHAGFAPEKGISAILTAGQALSRVKLGRLDEKTTANLGTIHGGSGKNIVPERVVIEGEVRSTEDERAKAAVEAIIREFEQAAIETGATVQASVQEMIKAYFVEDDSPVIRRYAKAMEELNYGSPVILGTFGGSDNNYFNKNGIPGIVVSCAMNDVHTVHEYFYIDELVKSTRIALQLVRLTTF